MVKIWKRIRVLFLSSLFLTALQIGSAAADTFPSKPLKLVIGYGAGGATDVICRLIAESLGKQLGQPVIVENRPGAGGGLGVLAVVRAEPDGYTLGYGASSNMIMVPIINEKANYDPLVDFGPISRTVTGAFTVVVNESLPVKTLREFIDYAKTHNRKLNYGTPGFASAPHLLALLFNQSADFEAAHIPYPGGAEIVTAAIRGDIEYYFDAVQQSIAQAKTGKLRILAVTSSERITVLPDVPTVQEQGVPDFEATVWHGIFAPKGTPKPVVDHLNAALRKALADKGLADKLAQLGLAPTPSTPEQFHEYLGLELAKWRNVVKRANLTAK